ncbi:acyl carrier protein [Yinghuangia sp. ASG 101]|uniref:acyl carrier protein n=1 Tax=Yinghuangia sp. ASG 101 TaxID=2896848 RepID=UPI001E38ADF2|nr:acyl carrier protein [Yinghuangia sp. ASG 101]UGQ11790.1 acyl carrier protein [Yinghuangia sp. ASG 101]
MAHFTLDELRGTLRECVGTDADVDLDGDILDIEFTDLGMDSLVVYEIAVRLQDHLDVPIPDDALDDITTPRGFIDYLNARLVP